MEIKKGFIMKKKAQSAPPYWESLKQKLRQPEIGLRSEIIQMLNNVNQIVWDQSPPQDNPNAVAYVSSQDANQDGKIDKIHFVLSAFPPNATEEEVESLVHQVAQTLVHEHEHIQDFNPSLDNPFPGGEARAESAERAFSVNANLEKLYNFLKKSNLKDEAARISTLINFNKNS